MKIKRLTVGLYQTNCYIVENNDYLLIIDPGDEYSKVARFLSEKPTHIVLTHTHFDHIGACKDIHNAIPNAKFYWGEYEDYDPVKIKQLADTSLGSRLSKPDYILPKPEALLKDKQDFLDFKVLHTPGHTMGSICLLNERENVLFSGDTLFYHSYGRTDLGGSNEAMYNSLIKLMALNKDTVVYPGHGFSTSIEEELSASLVSTLAVHAE